MWHDIIPLIENHHRFVITSHVNLDCDALGCELALAEHLHNLGKQVSIINSDETPAGYSFLDPQKRAKKYIFGRHTAEINQAEVVIVVDASGSWKRVGNHSEVFEKTKAIKVCIDHHPEAVDFVDVAVVDTTAAAAAQLIFDLLVTMKATITPSMAQALYAGILTDTGNFRFPKTSPQTHRIAAELLTYGVDTLYVYKQIHEQSSPGRVRLKGYVLSNIELAADGQIAYYSLTQRLLKSYGVTIADLDGFAGLGQEIKGVRVVIYCMELKDNRVKISLRSDSSIAINHIAAEYGGGGHDAAAGATTNGKIKQIMPALVARVMDELARQNQPER